MLIDLVPSFLEAIAAPDPIDGYRRYFQEHQAVLSAYWSNYIFDPDSSQAEAVIARTVAARRDDLHALLERIDVNTIAADALACCEELLEVDRPVDLYLTVGVGGANAGELVVAGRGIAFLCLEHFTGRPNPDTHGLGLSPDLIPLWIGHELAHTVRYTSPASESELARIIAEAGGTYDCWESSSRATLREMLVNEGLAVAASRATAPGFEPRQYLGYGSRQYRRLRELEAFLRQAIVEELDQTGIGYRLRYLGGGTKPSTRQLAGKVLPERSGYYLGHRLVESHVERVGIAAALRASAATCLETDRQSVEAQSA
jgi:hypothetical protein